MMIKWNVEFKPGALKSLEKLDKPSQKRIIKYLDNLMLLDDPKLKGKPLQGMMKNLWRYRVGDYRIICEIEGKCLVIIVIHIGHRKNVYSGQNNLVN